MIKEKIVGFYEDMGLEYCKGMGMVIFGFALFCLTSIISLEMEQFDYFTKPSQWFVISIIIMIIGFYIQIKRMKEEFSK